MAYNKSGTITVKILAQDLASGKLGKFMGHLDQVSRKGGLAGNIMQGVGMQFGMMLNPVGLATRGIGAFTSGLSDAVAAGAAEKANMESLYVALRENAEGWDQNTDSIERWLASNQKAYAFADTEQRSALTGLIGATKDLGEAQDLLGTAMDLARFKSIDLSTSADIMARVYAGNLGTLSRYGIILEKGATKTEALAAIQKMAKGQAEKYGNSEKAAAEKSEMAWGDAMEAIGSSMAPAKRVVDDFFASVAEWLTDLVTGPGDNPTLEDLRRELNLVKAEMEDPPRPKEGDWLLDGTAVDSAVDGIFALQNALEDLGVAPYVGKVHDWEDALRSMTSAMGLTESQLYALVTESIDAGKSLEEVAEATEKVWASATSGEAERWQNVFDAFVGSIEESQPKVSWAVSSITATVADLPPSMKKAIDDGKGKVSAAMRDLKWAMKHPFAGKNYVDFLKNKQESANKKLAQAIKDGNTEAAREASLLVNAIQTELNKLNQGTYALKVALEYDPLSSITVPKPKGQTGQNDAFASGWYASGGIIAPDSTGYVGERAMEKVTALPGGGALVTPMGATRGSSGPNVTVNVSMAGATFLGSEADGQQWAEAAGPHLARWMRAQA